ncbi:TOBE domain-containing protein [Desulfovibrio inopinatus]|uniref:TOBE domain-containing protein n=1 Tax=Desulfovibrio inopinatus TaxID=102109 RepID=UPI0003FBFA11|nr:TOBE domain-containing protein [Desulfovibrio inopinatus]
MTMYKKFEKVELMCPEELLALRSRIDNELTARDCDSPHSSCNEYRQDTLPRACRLFTVSEGVRWLNKHQLELLASSFTAWVQVSRDARTKRSRERVYLVFLLLRYSGARLGEVLSLDERKNFDYLRKVVMIDDSTAEGKKREVPLPEEVIECLREYCIQYEVDTTETSKSTERLFDLDQGFLRRKFYEQSSRSGLPKDLLNPRVLRNSRAIELLQGGMPMRAVQAILGHTKADFTASYVTLAQNDLRHIIHQHCHQEFGMETSARNTFHGEVTKVVSNPVMSEVTLRTSAGYEIVAIITNESREKLGLAEGKKASAMVKATWVILEKALIPPQTSARNAFPGVVTNIISDDVVVEVSGKLGDGTPICALITAGSFDKLGIGKGDSFIFMFKAMSVIIS